MNIWNKALATLTTHRFTQPRPWPFQSKSILYLKNVGNVRRTITPNPSPPPPSRSSIFVTLGFLFLVTSPGNGGNTMLSPYVFMDFLVWSILETKMSGDLFGITQLIYQSDQNFRRKRNRFKLVLHTKRHYTWQFDFGIAQLIRVESTFKQCLWKSVCLLIGVESIPQAIANGNLCHFWSNVRVTIKNHDTILLVRGLLLKNEYAYLVLSAKCFRL